MTGRFPLAASIATTHHRRCKAVHVFEHARLEYARERVPLDWAMTQNNLGYALGTLGEWQSGTEQLLQALRLTGLPPSWSGSRAQSPTAG